MCLIAKSASILRVFGQNAGMRSSYRWRKHLLGSLQGQLQLAIYLVIFAGFTGASSVGQYLGQRRIHAEERALVEFIVEECEHVVNSLHGDHEDLEKAILFHSGINNTIWIEYQSGDLYYPEMHGVPSKETLKIAMDSNPIRQTGQRAIVDIDGRRYRSELINEFPDKTRLWMISRLDENLRALSSYLLLTVAIWASFLVITMLIAGLVIEKIIQPLKQLNAYSSDLTADTLSYTKLELKRAPREVEELKDSINDLLQRLALSWTQQKQFVSTVSHELRTPMTIIQGYLQRTIKRSKNLSENEAKGLQIANEETIRMRAVLDDLLELSRSDSGKLSISNDSICLKEELIQVSTLARNTIPRDFQLVLPKNQHLKAQADPAKLQQVLLDLIENANKYSPEGTPIKIVLREEAEGPAIDVIDQGIGIPPEELDLVFERFQRGSNAPHKTGSGLGLSLVKLFVEGMGGRIEVASRIGEGSQFTVHLKT